MNPREHFKDITCIIMYWYPYVGATQPIYKAIFEHLLKKGYRIHIVAGLPHYRKGREELWKEYKNTFYKESIENRMHIKRTLVFSPKVNIAFDKNSILRRLINYTSFSISAFLIILSDKKSKSKFFFIPTFPPFFGGLLACAASAVKKIPFIYNVQDVYPDILFSMKLFRFRPISYLLERMEKFICSRSTHIIALSNKVRETLQRKGVQSEKITVIPNFCASDFSKPLPKNNTFLKEYNLQNKFIVLYAGNIGQPQGAEFILKAARILENKPDILFVFAGRGEKKEEIQQSAKNDFLKNVLFIPLQPFERMPFVWSSADVSLVSLRKNMSHLSFPSKIYSIFSSGKPIIAMSDKKSEIWEVVDKSGGGICVQSEDSDDLAGKILFLYNNPILRKSMGEKGREYVEKNFSKKLILNKYEELFEKLYNE